MERRRMRRGVLEAARFGAVLLVCADGSLRAEAVQAAQMMGSSTRWCPTGRVRFRTPSRASTTGEWRPSSRARIASGSPRATRMSTYMGPSRGQQVLWLAPEREVLEVIDRRSEWVAIRLTPEMRQRGIVVRCYRNEHIGWMHESTVEEAE